MKRIYKYQVRLNDTYNGYIQLPYGAEVLSAINQYNRIVLYCLVDDEEDRTEQRTLIVAATGEGLPQETIDKIKYYHFQFLGTVSLYGGNVIWHIWIK